MSTELKMKMTLPDNFRQACEDMQADPQQVLQAFVNDLLLVAQLAAPGQDAVSTAGEVLRRHLAGFHHTPPPDYRTRDTNIRYTKEVIALLRTSMPAAKREKRYHRIIDNWHAALQLVNN